MGFEWLRSKEGQMILAAIWGLGLAALFRKACVGRNCMVLSAPPIKDFHGKVYKFDGKCYKYEVVSTGCTAESIGDAPYGAII